uniref:Fibronectin type-III domain-containing protein n=1 Tax=Macrostomum lignano TaxID=282301 RepID=A0A1I8JPP6_9PLAT
FLILGVWAPSATISSSTSRSPSTARSSGCRQPPSWRVVDVTEVSRIAEFDFLMDESHGLTKDTEYFVALSGCSSTQCRTAGFAKFNTWQQGGGPQNLAPPSLREAAQPNKDQTTLRAIVCCCTKADYKETAEVCDRQTAQLGTDSSASAAAAIPSSDGLGYTTYAEILSDVGRHDNDQSGAGRSVAASSGSEKTARDLEVISNHEMHTGFGKLDLPAGNSESAAQHSFISCQHSSLKQGSRSGRTPRFTDVHSTSLVVHCSKLYGRRTVPAHRYQNRMPKAYTSTDESYTPLNSSGGMWIGVPTMLPLIIACGLQKPRSVSLARLRLSSSTFFSLMSRCTQALAVQEPDALH